MGGLEASSGTVRWYRSSYGTDLDNSEIASLVLWSNIYHIPTVAYCSKMVCPISYWSTGRGLLTWLSSGWLLGL